MHSRYQSHISNLSRESFAIFKMPWQLYTYPCRKPINSFGSALTLIKSIKQQVLMMNKDSEAKGFRELEFDDKDLIMFTITDLRLENRTEHLNKIQAPRTFLFQTQSIYSYKITTAMTFVQDLMKKSPPMSLVSKTMIHNLPD